MLSLVLSGEFGVLLGEL